MYTKKHIYVDYITLWGLLCGVICGYVREKMSMSLLWHNFTLFKFNSSPPSATYMCQWIGLALVQIMACHLFGAKSLSKPVLCYCQLDHWRQTSVKFESKSKTLHSWNCIWKCHLRNRGHFIQGKMSWRILIVHVFWCDANVSPYSHVYTPDKRILTWN